jgi:site-specific DNA recombinase
VRYTVALYARVSTQRQAQTHNVEQQLDRLRAHAAAQGWAVAPDAVFRDDGYSGATLKRAGLDALRDRAAGARLDRILVTAPDRLARNYVHQVLLVEELERHGAVVEFLDRPMSQDPHDRLLLQIRGAVAEYERTLIADRMRRGRLRKLQAGTLLPWTRPPYGYRLDPDRPRDPRGVRLEPAEATVVRDLFAWYLDEGLTLVGLANRLRTLGVCSPLGCACWSTSALRGVLTNPTYAGTVYAGRTRSDPARSRHSPLRPVSRRGATTRRASDGEWLPVAQVPALVSTEQVAAARARLAHNRATASRNAHPERYLLRALVSCGECQQGCVSRRLPPAYDYYLCRSKPQIRVLLRRERCPARYIPAAQLDALVWEDLCHVLQHPDLIAHTMARAQAGHLAPQELQARRSGVRRGQASLAQQRERLTEAYLAGALELEEYRRRRADVEARLAALEQQAAQLAADAARCDESAGLAAHAGAFCARVAATLANADYAQRRALVELLIDRVVVTGDLVEIRYVVPTSPDGEHQRFSLLRADYSDVLPRREVVRQRAPGAPAAVEVEDGVPDLAQRVRPRPAGAPALRRRHQRPDDLPLRVRQVRRVRGPAAAAHRHARHRPAKPVPLNRLLPTFSTLS